MEIRAPPWAGGNYTWIGIVDISRYVRISGSSPTMSLPWRVCQHKPEGRARRLSATRYSHLFNSCWARIVPGGNTALRTPPLYLVTTCFSPSDTPRAGPPKFLPTGRFQGRKANSSREGCAGTSRSNDTWPNATPRHCRAMHCQHPGRGSGS